MGKPLWEHVLEFLAGLLAKQTMEKSGATPEQMSSAKFATVELGTGYRVPLPPEGVLESRDMAHCHPELQRRYALVKADFEKETGRQLFETCTWRSAQKQQELFQKGRRGIPGEKIVTKLDGVTKKSRHMVFPSEAVDVCVDADPGPGKHPVWDEVAYAPLGPLCLKHGLAWGGSWTWKDVPHLELPAGAS